MNNLGLGEGDTIDLRDNPLTMTSLKTCIPQLEVRRVNVLYTIPPPQAGFSATPTVGIEPLAVTFTDLSTSYDGIVSWWWSFGDGQVSTVHNPVHTYFQGGAYTVSLTVTEADGSSDAETKIGYITVSDTGPTAGFCATPLSGTEPLAVTFADLSTSYDGIVSWLWGFGDGTFSTQQNPAHTYLQDGAYTVTLTVTEADGDTDTETRVGYITVSGVTPWVVFEDSGRGTRLYVSTSEKSFRFTAPDGFDTGIIYDSEMLVANIGHRGGLPAPLDSLTMAQEQMVASLLSNAGSSTTGGVTLLVISYRGEGWSLFALAIDGSIDFCTARVSRSRPWKTYSLSDLPGVEQPIWRTATSYLQACRLSMQCFKDNLQGLTATRRQS